MLSNNIIYINVFIHRENRIVRMPLEEIVAMAVLTQIKQEFHIEMIKVQGIVARTQLVRLMRAYDGAGCSNHYGCDICDEGHCIQLEDNNRLKEIWGDEYENRVKIVEKAVRETEGVIMTFDNKPIDARFHDTCGGSTENSESVMAREIVYLRRVLCDYCTESPNWDDSKSISVKELEEKLNVKFPSLKPTLKTSIESFFDDVKRDEYGRVISIKISGKEFKGTEIIELLGLNSTRFSFSPTIIAFVTRGKGDGLGLCQYGGNQMALEGKNYLEILNYYFTGIEIKKIEAPCIEKPLSGRIIMLDPGHGGENSHDYIGVNGTSEKELVLKISQKLKASLEELGAKVSMTRDKDEYVSLSNRAQMANKLRPDFFLSVHLNGYANPSIHGCEIYYYRSDKESETLAKSIMANLTKDGEILDRGIRVADFYLLREVNVGSLHLELEYITNPNKELKLNDETYIDKVIARITAGFVEYYKY
ncbi:stage II sporulation protein D [Proteiniborus sp. MB09-C3]|uniref:stage II sporulation protein D n=1 Tax=Proteiniborus sp. MB09-C3 TaxID=3050072 RepID=UPI0025527078|nr:stage II sporulation protein D [Proteiniborus sp. MB09-C3]WIV12281.1 stage II sporulation protein D [Proteiniborus sp. MB09-C3]